METMHEVKDKAVSEETGRVRRQISRRAVYVTASVVCALALAGGCYRMGHKDEVSTDDARTDGHIISMSSHVAGYVTELDVGDKEFVDKGHVLLRIQSAD
jgi:multidrug resistance efflux pump